MSAGAGTGGRPKGLPKTGGRKKGTLNRATVGLREKLAALGYDPMIELVKISRDHKATLEQRERIAYRIAPYVYPTRKPVAESIEEPSVTNVITVFDHDDNDSEEVDARADASAEA